MKLLFTLIVGLIFGTGIALSGMMDPAKVLNFFDLAGTWDPSLAFVMGGALVITFFGYKLVLKRSTPLFGEHFQIPTGATIDKKLVGGSALFGIGWGIAGFCPGAALPALGTGRWEVVLFLVSVAIGFALRKLIIPVVPQNLNFGGNAND